VSPLIDGIQKLLKATTDEAITCHLLKRGFHFYFKSGIAIDALLCGGH
jgi:hypothetical protein